MTSRSLIVLLFGLILQSFVAGHISAQDDSVAEAIREKVEQIKLKNELKVGNAQISSFRVLPGSIRDATSVQSGLIPSCKRS
jgi:undecaprenyl pyrophosphate phosphatase UppP